VECVRVLHVAGFAEHQAGDARGHSLLRLL
jgi:hypothetical protein